MRLALAASLLLLAGCEEPGPAPEVPVQDEPADVGCNRSAGSIELPASMDTLVLDYGAVAIWAWDLDSMVWNDDFPQDGALAQREFTIHRLGFPHAFELCLEPGRYLVRAILDLNHNGWICEPGELWGATEYIHPAADSDDLQIVLDNVLSANDGCLGENTIPQD